VEAPRVAIEPGWVALVRQLRWAVQRPNPGWLKPPAGSPPQYRPGITCPCRSSPWHFALMRGLALVSCTSGVT